MEPPCSGLAGEAFFSKEVNKVQKVLGSCRVSHSTSSGTRQERKQIRMRSKNLAISAVALLGLSLPASAGAHNLIRAGSGPAQPLLHARFSPYSHMITIE